MATGSSRSAPCLWPFAWRLHITMHVLQKRVIADVDVLTSTQKVVDDRCRIAVLQARFYQVAYGEKCGHVCVRFLDGFCFDPSFEVLNVFASQDDSPKTFTPAVTGVARQVHNHWTPRGSEQFHALVWAVSRMFPKSSRTPVVDKNEAKCGAR